MIRQDRPRRLAVGGMTGATLLALAAWSPALPAGAATAHTTTGAATPQTQLSGLIDSYVASAVAPNGDKNPYGLAVVPKTAGKLVAGNVLVAEFDNAAGDAAGGTTILQVNPTTHAASVFFTGAPVAGPVGIAINPGNDGVWIGDYGSAQDGTAANDLLISAAGALVATFNNATTSSAASFVGVWGQGVSLANGAVSFYWGNAGDATTGTGGGDVWRLTPNPTATTKNGQPVNSTYAQIATGQAETAPGGNAGSAAGPQGFAYDQASGILYETNDASNAIYAIPGAAAATGPVSPTLVYQGSALDNPENVVIDPANGNLLVLNGAGNNDLVEITPQGQVVAVRDLAPREAPGALFGLAVGTDAAGKPVFYYDNSVESSIHELSVDLPAKGYDLAASDGGVFTYGNATFHGSAGAVQLAHPVVGMAATPDGRGYWLVASDGGIFTYGDAGFFGSAAGKAAPGTVVGMAATPDGRGYWLVGSNGAVYPFGDAGSFGSAAALHLAHPVVGIAATPDGGGYWLVASDGGIFTYGDAGFFGAAAALHLAHPVVGMAATPDGAGYWLVTSGGGIFTYGNAGFFGSAGAIHLAHPVVGMAATPDGAGYWLVASGGGIFTYGNAGFFGSAGAIHLARPVVGMAATPDGGGYYLVAADGGIFTYGNAGFFGSAAAVHLARPVVGMAVTH